MRTYPIRNASQAHAAIAASLLALALALATGCQSRTPLPTRLTNNPSPLPPASAAHLPRWRGFNLLDKYNKDWMGHRPFAEDDFRLIAALGFNFARLPLDYRTWTSSNDWTQFDEPVLREIDQAVAWGSKYGVHVCLNFHRAPGYTVTQPPEPTDLWTDAEAQRVCAMHWAEFARRYKGIPNSRLSFNLFNEPPPLEPAVYAQTVSTMLRAIREQDPDRLVIADGLSYGRLPCETLIPLGVAQSTRGYLPMSLTHYRAPWVYGAHTMTAPVWPIPMGTSFLFAPESACPAEPISIAGPFPIQTRLRMKIGAVSAKARLVVKADHRTVFDKAWVCDENTGTWSVVNFLPEWGVFQNTLRQDQFADIPAGTRQVEFRNLAGDWMTLDEIAFRPANATNLDEQVLAFPPQWHGVNETIRYVPTNRASPFLTRIQRDRTWLWNTAVAPWQQLKKDGVGVMVGEFGAYNQTPHETTLRWMEDCLATWKKAGIGWALWNLRGDFGILDSNRRDVAYEDFQGHKLDREMLTLLQKY